MNSGLRDVLGYSIIKYLALAVGFGRVFVSAAALGPYDFGVLGVYLLVLGVLAFSHLGVLYSMNREYALWDVQSEGGTGSGILSSGFAVIVSVSVVLGVASCVSLALIPYPNGLYWGISLLIAAADLFRSYFTNYFRLLSKSRSLNLLDVIYQLVSLVVLLALIGTLGVSGALLAQLSGGVACLFFCLASARGLRPRFESRVIRVLFAGGVPLLLYNLGFYLMGSADRFFVAWAFGSDALGQYTFSNQIATGALVFLSSLLFLYYPTAIRRMHRGAVGTAQVFEFSLKGSRYLEGLGVILYVLGAVGVEALVLWLLPEYHEGVLVLRIFLLGAIAGQCAFFWNVSIVSNGRQWMLVVVQGLVICLSLALNLGVYMLGLGLVGVAFASLLCMLCYAVTQQWLNIHFVLGLRADAALVAARGFARFGVFVVLACVLALLKLNMVLYGLGLVALSTFVYGGVWVRLASQVRGRG